MSTPQQGQRSVTAFVPIYLLVVGLGLLVGFGYLLTVPEEEFTAGLALVGGLTMLVSAGLVVAWGNKG